LARYENIFLKATPHNFLEARRGKATPESFFRKAVAEFGASRIAWGSNFPAAAGTLAELLVMAEASFAALSPDDRDWIFTRTALSLYPALGA